MKIIFFANTDWYLYNFRLELAQALQTRGDEVVLVSPKGEYVPLLQELGFRWICFPIDRRGLNPIAEISTIFRLLSLYHRENPDLVHQFTVKCVLYGSLVAHLLGIHAVVNSVEGLGYVFTNGEGNRRWLRNLVIFFYRLVLKNTWVVFQNPDDRSFFINSQLADAKRTAIIMGTGVDIRKFTPQFNQQEIPHIILPARLLWDKGVGEFVEAARQLRSKGVGARFILVGDCDKGNPGSINPAQLHEWANEGVIEWWGWKDKMEYIYAQASIVCLPSYYREGLPKTLIEAAACGCPIVTTDLPGCREVVRHGENGLLVRERDASALAQALALLINNPTLRMKMGVNGRNMAEQKFSSGIIIPQILELYKTVCEENESHEP